jgi:hypothetical protein
MGVASKLIYLDSGAARYASVTDKTPRTVQPAGHGTNAVKARQSCVVPPLPKSPVPLHYRVFRGVRQADLKVRSTKGYEEKLRDPSWIIFRVRGECCSWPLGSNVFFAVY